MTDQPITMEFLAKRLNRVLDRIGTVEDQITVLTGICMRLEGSFDGFATEVRGMYRLLDRMEHVDRAVPTGTLKP